MPIKSIDKLMQFTPESCKHHRGDILRVAHEAVFFSLCKVICPRKSRLSYITRTRTPN
jgi:hypothetical protein